MGSSFTKFPSIQSEEIIFPFALGFTGGNQCPTRVDISLAVTNNTKKPVCLLFRVDAAIAIVELERLELVDPFLCKDGTHIVMEKDFYFDFDDIKHIYGESRVAWKIRKWAAQFVLEVHSVQFSSSKSRHCFVVLRNKQTEEYHSTVELNETMFGAMTSPSPFDGGWIDVRKYDITIEKTMTTMAAAKLRTNVAVSEGVVIVRER
jgi:hypothetical protein